MIPFWSERYAHALKHGYSEKFAIIFAGKTHTELENEA